MVNLGKPSNPLITWKNWKFPKRLPSSFKPNLQKKSFKSCLIRTLKKKEIIILSMNSSRNRKTK